MGGFAENAHIHHYKLVMGTNNENRIPLTAEINEWLLSYSVQM